MVGLLIRGNVFLIKGRSFGSKKEALKFAKEKKFKTFKITKLVPQKRFEFSRKRRGIQKI